MASSSIIQDTLPPQSKRKVFTDEYGSIYFYNAVTASIKSKDEYSEFEIAIGVIDAMIVMLDALEEEGVCDAVTASSKSINGHGVKKVKTAKPKKKKFVSAAAEARFKKNQTNDEKKQKRLREKLMATYLRIVIPQQTGAISANDVDGGGLKGSTETKTGLNNAGTLFTLEDTIRWRLEREAEQIKQRRVIRKERMKHQKQVLTLKKQQEMLIYFRTELTRYFLSQIECSTELLQQRILLLSSPQQLAETEAKRKKTMEPEIAERYAKEQQNARAANLSNIQKVFVLIDEAALGKLHLLQILFGIFTLERSQHYALKVRGLAELISSQEIQKFVLDFVSNSHLRDCAVTMDEFVELVAIIEDVVDHFTSVKNAVKEAEDEIEATLEATASKPGTSLLRARVGIVSKKKVEQEIAVLKATEDQIRLRQEQEQQEVFRSDEKWELERREYEERESTRRSYWASRYALKAKEEELKLVEKDEPTQPVEEDSASAAQQNNSAEEASAATPEAKVYPESDSLSSHLQGTSKEDEIVFEIVRSLVTPTERMMSQDSITSESKSPKRRVHKKADRTGLKRSVRKKLKDKNSKTNRSEADAKLQQAMQIFESEENERKRMHSEEVQMTLFLERNRRALERPLLQVQDAAYNSYIRMLSHTVNPTSFLYRLEFLRCLLLAQPQQLVLQMLDRSENTLSDGSNANYFILQTVPCRNESEGNHIFKQLKLLEEKLRSSFVANVVSVSKHTFQFFADSGMLVECWPILFIATEYFPAGSWLQHFRKRYFESQGDSSVPAYASVEQHLLATFREVAAGLAAMHSLGIFHLNLSLDNIYVSHCGESEDRPQVKISGFLCCKVAFTEDQLRTGAMQQCISYCIAPPELFKEGKGITAKADVWMLGCALVEALVLWQRQQLLAYNTNTNPQSEEKLLKEEKIVAHLKTIQEILQEIPIAASTTMRSLLRMMLQPNPGQRPQMSQVIDYLSFAGKQNLMSHG